MSVISGQDRNAMLMLVGVCLFGVTCHHGGLMLEPSPGAVNHPWYPTEILPTMSLAPAAASRDASLDEGASCTERASSPLASASASVTALASPSPDAVGSGDAHPTLSTMAIHTARTMSHLAPS